MRLRSLRFVGSSFTRTITAMTGYLRPRPDPYLERMLRDAFERFDRDLGIFPLSGRDRALAAPIPATEQPCAQCGGWDRRGD